MKHSDPVAGDIGFAHTSDFVGRAIRFGERLRWRKGSTFNHVFIVDRVVDGVAYVLQADAHGVTNTATLESVGEHEFVTLPAGVDVERMLFFARRQLKDRYSWTTILAIAVDIITPRWFPSFRSSSKNKTSWICSTLTAESLRYGGWYYDWPSIYSITPSQLYEAIVGV